ncbi:MAG: hypothetical protein ACO2PO_07695 [Candidatus Calescibacterium sp.]
MLLILKLALLIISLEGNRFNVVSVGVGYLGISEKPGFTISELLFAEFQDFKLIPSLGSLNFGLFLGGVKIFPSLLFDREDKTWEFIRQFRYMIGGGLFPASLMIFSRRLFFTVLEVGDVRTNVFPFLKFQIIPISDALIAKIFNPALFSRKVYTPSPLPHFEVSSGAKGVSGSFAFELKFGIRTYSTFIPELPEREKIEIDKYMTPEKYKPIRGEPEYDPRWGGKGPKYGLMFFFNFLIGFDIPGYYATKVVVVEEGKIKEVGTASPELEKRIAELEKKLPELEKRIAELEKQLPEAEKMGEEERVKLEEEIKRLEAELAKGGKPNTEEKQPVMVAEMRESIPVSLGSEVIKIESYKDGNLTLSWTIPPELGASSLELERCLGYNCEKFRPISSFPPSVSNYTDKIVINQVYCYRISVKVDEEKNIQKTTKVKKAPKTITSGKVCAYVSIKGEIVKVYF